MLMKFKDESLKSLRLRYIRVKNNERNSARKSKRKTSLENSLEEIDGKISARISKKFPLDPVAKLSQKTREIPEENFILSLEGSLGGEESSQKLRKHIGKTSGKKNPKGSR